MPYHRMCTRNTLVNAHKSCESTHERHWTLCFESGAVPLFHQWHLANDWEFHVGLVHLSNGVTLAIRSWDRSRVDDLDRTWLSAMATCHFRIQLSNCTIDVNVTDLLVHVVGV